jgi:hypothetical protein
MRVVAVRARVPGWGCVRVCAGARQVGAWARARVGEIVRFPNH